MPWLCEQYHDIWWLPKNFGEGNVVASVRKLHLHQRSWVFQYDNDLKHTSKGTQKWLQTKCWRVLKWPAMSPDLKPVEHLWRDLKRAVGRRHLSNLNALEQFAKEQWYKIPVDRCKKLIHGYRKRLISVIFSKGGEEGRLFLFLFLLICGCTGWKEYGRFSCMCCNIKRLT